MTLSQPLYATLQLVGSMMREATDDWWVIASAAASLHGADQPAAADVDVLASDRDARSVLRRLGAAPVAAGPHPLFQSRVLGRWTDPPLTVEIMAGFHVRSGGEWRPIAPATREAFRVGAESVFAPSREELADILTLIGRPKDLDRARRLRASHTA